MTDISLNGVFGIANAIIPKGGPKVARALLDFGSDARITIDGQQIVSQGQIEFLQGVYIDNGSNGDPLTITVATTNQRIIVPSFTQGYYSILAPNNPRLIAETPILAGKTITMLFYNVPIQSQQWKTQ